MDLEYNFYIMPNYFPGRQQILVWVIPVLGTIYQKYTIFILHFLGSFLTIQTVVVPLPRRAQYRHSTLGTRAGGRRDRDLSPQAACKPKVLL